MSTPSIPMIRLSRRALVASSVAGAALAHVAPRHQVLAQSSTPDTTSPPPAADSAGSPAAWRTWILTSPDELRPVSEPRHSRRIGCATMVTNRPRHDLSQASVLPGLLWPRRRTFINALTPDDPDDSVGRVFSPIPKNIMIRAW